MAQATAKRTERANMEDVAAKPAKPSQRITDARAESDRAEDLLDEIDALLTDEIQAQLEEERLRAAFKAKLASLSLGPRHCCGACTDCPYGYRS